MRKKRTNLHNHQRARTTRHRSDRLPDRADHRLTNRILAAFYQSGKALSINDVRDALNLPRTAKDDIERGLNALGRNGLLRQSGKRLFALAARHPLAEATVSMSPSGHAFATDLSRQPVDSPATDNGDPYIPPTRLHTAQHGDRVLVAVQRSRRAGKREAEIITILNRATEHLAGLFALEGKHGVVFPDDSRFPFVIPLSIPATIPVNNGDAVRIKLHYRADAAGPLGELVEVLGDPSRASVQARLVIEKYHLPHLFSPQAEQESRQPPPDPAANVREDLRDVSHVTIDGADAKDFDDAIAVEKTRTGYRLFVSIADVGAFVPVGSTLDREAHARGTSVYFPATVIPMLPENLSNKLCSLMPDQDRLAITAILDFSKKGTLTGKRFIRSTIRSRQRFTYDAVERIINAGDRTVNEHHAPCAESLNHAAELARILNKNRRRRGSIAFSMPEAKVILDETEHIESIIRAPRLFAHQIIEEFMLAANEAVAALFSEQHRAFLFRIHESPDPEKLDEFIAFSKIIGIQLPEQPITPDWYNRVIEQVDGSPRQYLVNNLLLRTMQQARYSDENRGHFGLASPHYTHFTSPIRRYPDLIVHRLLCRLMSADEQRPAPVEQHFSPAESLADDARYLSERERTAVSAERDILDRLKRIFMTGRRGETFSAVASGITENAVFIELLEVFVDGVIPITSMSDDRYLFDEKRHRLVGDISGRTIQIGDLIKVVMEDVDTRQNRVLFRLSRRN